MSELNEKPATDEYLKRVVAKIIEPADSGNCVTIVSFPGQGFKTFIQYIIEAGLYKFKNRSFYILDPTSLESVASVVRAVDPATSLMTTTGLYEAVKKCVQTGSSFCFYIPNFSKVYSPATVYSDLLGLIKNLRSISPSHVNFIFNTSGSFDLATIERLGSVSNAFLQTVVEGKDFIFDDDCADVLLKSYGISGVPAEKLKELSFGDPLVFKYLAHKNIANEATAEGIAEFYSLSGADYLDNRYLSIFKSCGLESPYLVSCGIMGINGKYLNPLVEYFATNRLHSFADRLEGNSLPHTGVPALTVELRNKLTSRELSVLDLLAQNLGKAVSRDDLSKVLWKDTANYSDWALDQFMWRLKKKLGSLGYSKVIKNDRSFGFMLI